MILKEINVLKYKSEPLRWTFGQVLEHDMKYKRDVEKLKESFKERDLKACAEIIADTDIRMQKGKIKNEQTSLFKKYCYKRCGGI